MEHALRLLDEANCSADAGAHLDLALARLREAMEESFKDGFASQPVNLALQDSLSVRKYVSIALVGKSLRLRKSGSAIQMSGARSESF